MPLCLVCSSQPIPRAHVMCQSCYQDHHEAIREVERASPGPEELRRKLWGQRYENNRTPANRARIAYAAHLLASEGDDEPLAEAQRVFASRPVPEPRQEPARAEPLAEEARAVGELDRLLGHAPSAADTPGKFRTKDGHWVRSKSERDIANFLFDDRIPTNTSGS